MPYKNEHPLYRIWWGMLRRCYDPKNPQYKNYGGRGISVCERWRRSFIAFAQDMGDRPEGFSIDRIHNNGNYGPTNCRWTTQKVQCRNTRIARNITIEGISYSVGHLAEISGLKTDTIANRAKKVKTLQELIDPQKRVFHAGLAMTPNSRTKTHCKQGHEFTDANTYWTPAGYRQCRACKKVWDDKRRGKH